MAMKLEINAEVHSPGDAVKVLKDIIDLIQNGFSGETYIEGFSPRRTVWNLKRDEAPSENSKSVKADR